MAKTETDTWQLAYGGQPGEDPHLAIIVGRYLKITIDRREDYGDPMPAARLIVDAPTLLNIVRAFIDASDGCHGHQDCQHPMTPWQEARALLDRHDP
jgi:hypothetical protein